MLSMTIIGKEDVKAESPGDDFANTAWDFLHNQGNDVFYQDQFLKSVYRENGYSLGDLYRFSGKQVSYENANPGDLVFMEIDGREAIGILTHDQNGGRNNRVIFVSPGTTWLEVHSLKPGVEYYDYIVQIRNYF